MCLVQGPQHSDAGEARTRYPLVSSQALYLWATALPLKMVVYTGFSVCLQSMHTWTQDRTFTDIYTWNRQRIYKYPTDREKCCQMQHNPPLSRTSCNVNITSNAVYAIQRYIVSNESDKLANTSIHRRHCVVSLSKTYNSCSVNPGWHVPTYLKNCWLGRKESNKKNTNTSTYWTVNKISKSNLPGRGELVNRETRGDRSHPPLCRPIQMK